MQKSKYTPEEIEAMEMEESTQKDVRGSGLSLVSVRDRGWAKLENGYTVMWHTNRKLQEGEARQVVTPGSFRVDTGKESLIFDAEDLRKWLRWA